MGKLASHLKSQMVETMEIPRDLAYKEPLVTITGNTRLCVENYKSIAVYTSDEIVMITAQGKLQIAGSSLEILSYTNDEMLIAGRIAEILFIH